MNAEIIKIKAYDHNPPWKGTFNPLINNNFLTINNTPFK